MISFKKENVVFILCLVLVVTTFLTWDFFPVKDPNDYFQFADQRSLFGIPHFFDVTSNLFFALVGIFGFTIFFKSKTSIDIQYKYPLLGLSLSLFLTAIGSAYFHWNPTPSTLFWDRLPMALGFSSLVVLFLIDQLQLTKIFLLFNALKMFAVFTVLNIDSLWQDLRPYIFLQFGSLIFIVGLLLFVNKGRIPRKYVILGFIFYVVAKVLEGLDQPIFDMIGISGHTLKHISAATGALYLMQGMYYFFSPEKLRERK